MTRLFKKNNKETQLKNIITEITNTLEGINSRVDDTEEWISHLSSGNMPSLREKNNFKTENNLGHLWDNIKWMNIHTYRGSEKGEKRREEEEREGNKMYLKK